MTKRRGLLAVGGVEATHAAVGAWLAHADAALCSTLGAELRQELVRDLERAGIDTTRVRSTGEPLPTADQLSGISAAWAVHLCAMPPHRQSELIDAVAGHVALVTLDTVFTVGEIEPEANDILTLAARCDAFLPSREDIAHLWPGQPPREVLRLLVRHGCRTAVIKLGRGGSIGIHDETITWMPAFPVTTSGSPGAGDAYCGGFAARYAADRNIAVAMAWGTAAASAVIESAGPFSALTEHSRRRVAQRAELLVRENRGKRP